MSSFVLIIVLTFLSGIGDALGFIYASRIWQDGRPFWMEAGKSALAFQSGVFMYWLALRYLKDMGVVAAEIQTLIWFVATIAGVAILSGKFLQWQRLDQAVAVGILAGIGWLMYRTGG